MNTSEEAPAYTYADLLASLQALTPEQLTQPAKYWGENCQGNLTGLLVTEEDYVNPSGDGAEPASAYRPKPGETFNESEHMTEDEIADECVLAAGAVMIEVD
ncbi:MAG: hypothetical protein ACRYFX_18725 [Janthinobacterium lividum]